MPFDATPPEAPASRRTRIMPWAGRNAAILARRAAKPRLPRGWGASFTRKLHYLPTVVAPALPDAPDDDDGSGR